MQALHAQTPVRVAGLLYLVIILSGLSAELVLRGPLMAGGAEAIAANLPRFRLGLLADMTMLLADIVLALLFFALLRGVHAGLARAAMVFRLMQAALIGMALTLLSVVPGMIAAGDHALAMHMTTLHANGYDIGLILFGVNSLLMAVLLTWSGGVPRIIAWSIGGSGLVYIAGGLARLAAPDLLAVLQYAYALPILAETALCLWLIVMARI